MLRNYDLRDLKLRQEELIQEAAQRRLAKNVNRAKRSSTWTWSALRLRPHFAR